MNVLSFPSPQNVNQWDEEWELGGIVWATGVPYSATDRIRSKNFCKCEPNTNYYLKSSSASVGMCWYDNNFSYFGNNQSRQNVVVTSPSNACYFKIVALSTTTYNNDISINYPSTDTSYHAYKRNIVLTSDNKVATVGG